MQKNELLRIGLYAILLIVGVYVNADACSIFVASNQQTVLVGNNEDYKPGTRTFLWARPKTAVKLGYIFWGFEEKYPEGGMNEYGLFFDAAALPEPISIEKNPSKPDFEGYLVESVLSKCKTVAEALVFISKYNLTWQEKAQILLTDRSGDYAVVHANYVIRRNEPVFGLTNYALNESNKKFNCWRRQTGYTILNHKTPSVELMKAALSATVQKSSDNATLYSQICDLKKGTIYLFQQRDFTHVRELRLHDLLAKGEREILISTLFPASIADTLSLYLQTHSAQATADHYFKLKKAENTRFNFSEEQLDQLGYKLIDQDKLEQAKAIFEVNLTSFPSSANAKASLANAYLLTGSFRKADSLYSSVYKKDPKNVYVGLFKQSPEGTVTFRIAGLPGAKKILLYGSFSDKEPVSFTRTNEGDWVLTRQLKPGEYTYKFQVDDTYWMEDWGNKLHKKVQDWYDSWLLVR